MLMAKRASDRPFDITTFSSLLWSVDETLDQRRRAFREHWDAVKNRPPIVPEEPLIS
jgi:hypothetical protein